MYEPDSSYQPLCCTNRMQAELQQPHKLRWTKSNGPWRVSQSRFLYFTSVWYRTDLAREKGSKRFFSLFHCVEKTLKLFGAQMSLTSPQEWEYSWRDYPIQHASSMSPHNRPPVAPHALCLCASVCVWVCLCVYSIIGPVGDGGSCGHKPTWNFLNKGLIFTGSWEEFLLCL